MPPLLLLYHHAANPEVKAFVQRLTAAAVGAIAGAAIILARRSIVLAGMIGFLVYLEFLSDHRIPTSHGGGNS